MVSDAEGDAAGQREPGRAKPDRGGEDQGKAGAEETDARSIRSMAATGLSSCL